MVNTDNTSIDKEVLSSRKIKSLLAKHKVPIEQWGVGTWRTFDDLVTYHQECRLFFRDEPDKLVIVVHFFLRQWLELYEDRQEFPDGHILTRNYNGIAETIERAETPQEAANRCLAEEVAFLRPSGFELSKCLTVEHREPVPSEKWLGIWALYHRHLFECVISRKLFRKDGYVERKESRSIFFKWRPRRQLTLKI